MTPHADLSFGRCFRAAQGSVRDPFFPSWSAGRQTRRIRRSFAAELDDQLDAVLHQSAGFARIVGEQTNPFDAEIAQDRSRQAEVPAIGLEPEGMIGLDRIDTGILQLVSLQLRHQADAAAFLILIDHEPAAFFGWPAWPFPAARGNHSAATRALLR